MHPMLQKHIACLPDSAHCFDLQSDKTLFDSSQLVDDFVIVWRRICFVGVLQININDASHKLTDCLSFQFADLLQLCDLNWRQISIDVYELPFPYHAFLQRSLSASLFLRDSLMVGIFQSFGIRELLILYAVRAKSGIRSDARQNCLFQIPELKNRHRKDRLENPCATTQEFPNHANR